MVYGVSWVFERARVGSYQANYLRPAPAWPVAKAVAASSCFPPVFSPMPIIAEAGTRHPKSWMGMSVSDGGLYDNLGLQPVETHGTILVSDGGQPFVPAVPRGLFGRAKAYISVMGKQAGALRTRLLIGQFANMERQGVYWGIASAPARYQQDAEGYTKQLATEVIAAIRTDMDKFSDGEIGVLMNHGYLLADIAVRTHVPHLIKQEQPKAIPYPALMDETEARKVLAGSDRRWWLGRR
jgi:NTE family protein